LIAKAQWIERYPKRTKTGFELEIAKSLVKFVRKATAKAKNLICVVNGKGRCPFSEFCPETGQLLNLLLKVQQVFN
jgi:hypothetical protein